MKPAEQHSPEPVSPASVRSELDKVLQSESFQRSPQMQRFLRYLVEETLAGRGQRIKEYVIGTEVFGRPADYDPQLDSLVRVEAHRLRRLLDQYYEGNGSDDGLRIGLNKGSYVPCFQEIHQARANSVSPAATPASKRSAWIWASVAIGIIAAVAVAMWVFYGSRASHGVLPSDATIAVLPFDNLSSEPGTEYFCFGLVDEITTELAKNGNLRVVARTSASRFKRGDDIPSIGKQLRADAVLEGSVQRSADRVRVTVQLINTANNLHVWSDNYEKPGNDLFAVQDQVAQAVTNAVQAHVINSSGKALRATGYSSDPQANELYWKGVYFRAPMGRTGWRVDLATSTEFLERAAGKDPKFAQAYAALADVYVSRGWERGGGPVTRDYMNRARKAATRALELQSNLGEAYGALGAVQFFYDYDREAAEKSFQQALLTDPSNGKARMWYSWVLVIQGRTAEAVAQAQQAKELDPLSYVTTTHLAVVYYLARQYDETIRASREALAATETAAGHGILGMAYEMQHNYNAAIAEYQTGLRLVPTQAYIKGMLGHAYGLTGRKQEALRLLEDQKLSFEEGGLSQLQASYIYMGLGHYDRALRLLEQDLELRDPDLPYINRDPVFDSVRQDPRFMAILGAMGLAK